MRPPEDLIDHDDPGLPIVQAWIDEATRDVEVLPRSAERAEEALAAVQVTTRSPMGALAYGTGGLLVDGGWVRVLGGGGGGLPGIDEWNRADEQGELGRLPGALVVGWDVLGGFFALNGGAFEGHPGHVFYFAPDVLEWESLECGYSAWLRFLFSGDLDDFYGDQRWPGWRAEVAGVSGDRGLSVVPFLCAEGPTVAERSRHPVPMEELWGLFVDGS